MTRQLLGIVALALIAASCGPGPLPPIPVPRPDYDRTDRFPSTGEDPGALGIAIQKDQPDEVRRLLEAGANPNARWGQRGDHHALQTAIEPYGWPYITRRIEIVRILLEGSADPNLRWCPFESREDGSGWKGCRSAEGMTPLIAAAAYDMTEIVELLLNAGADPTLRDWFGASALDYVPGEIAFELISRKLFPQASTRNHDALARLQNFGGAGLQTPRDATPLSRAITGDSMRLTLPPMPPPKINEVVNPAWLFYGRSANHVRLLLNIGADPNERVTRDWVDWTPLALAVTHYGSWKLRALLEAGADRNARWCFSLAWDSKGNVLPKDPACNITNGTTPLMEAASRGQVDHVQALLEHGADPALTDWNGKSASDLAKTDEIRALLALKRP